jgi:N-methylhydantoinase A
MANAITLDIGGTTAKASLIEAGAIAYCKEYEVGAEFTRSGKLAKGGGYALRAPTIDISEIGAGGGSIVWIDGGGALQVGPRSAGAHPGPVCYGLGGTEPTLADACLVLGYLDPAGLAGGTLKLDLDAARKALEDRVAAPLGLDVTALAHGVLRIAVSNMTRAIRSVSTERGKDPRDFGLVAFGGNGGLFAAWIARELEIPTVVLPPSAGIFSAFGLLCSDLEHHYTRTLLGHVGEIDPEDAEAIWTGLEAEARAVLGREGFSGERVRLQRLGELRYYSQSFELEVPWPAGPTTRKGLAALGAAFEDAHERAYGHRGRDGNIELVNLHLIAGGVPDRPRVPGKLRFASGDDVPEERASAYFGEPDGWIDTPVAGRASLDAAPRRGPLIIREFDTTVLVTPDFTVARDAGDNLVLERA